MKQFLLTTHLIAFQILIIFLCCFSFSVKAQVQDSISVQSDSIAVINQDTLIRINDSAKIKNVNTKVIVSYTIEGVVKDFTTSEPLSFATVFFKNTGTGMRTDLLGKFSFNLQDLPSDTLAISILGYAKKFILLDKSQAKQSFNIELERSSIEVKTVVFKYDRNPALTFIKKVIKVKASNDYNKANNYKCEIYNKLELDISKIPKKMFKSSLLLKKFDFIENYIDSTSEDKPFLPLFLTETISDFYFQKKPKKMKEFIKGTRISGYKNESVSKMLGGMYQNINVYDNVIPIFNISFVSPIANDAPNFYKYELTDTQIINNKLCFQVAFSPKRNGEHTFNGDFWIHDTDYAVQKVNMILTGEQGINWVNKVTLMQEFSNFEDTLWFLTKDKFYVDFLPPQGDKVAGFVGRKTTTYKDILVNHPIVDSVLNDKRNKSELIVNENASRRNEVYWNQVRHDSLSKNEKAIYQMIDTIQSLPIYKKYYNLFYFLGTGIKEIGPLELGSFYNLYSRNPVEGTRWRFSLGTTPKLFKNIYLSGYVAYGVRDQRWKYDAKALWILKRKPRMYLFAEIQHDIDNSMSQYDEAGSLDNIFSSIGRKKGVPWKLAFVDKQRFEFYNSYHSGFSHLLSFDRRTFTPYEPLPSNGIFNKDGVGQLRTITNEIGLELRFAYREQWLEGNYYRTSLGTKFPLLKMYIGQGFNGLLDGQYQYTKVRFTVSDNQMLKRYGSLYYNVFAGKIIGTVPYNLLEIHPGNEFYYYAPKAFNMMNRFEYISDTYAGLIMEHNLGSLFFKYIPYVEKMKIRTFWNAKGVYGSLTQANQQFNLSKDFIFQTLTKSPYIEVGTGAENIFKFLRVDCVWRVMPRGTEADIKARRFGVFGSFKFSF